MTAFAYYRLPYLHHAHYVAQREGEPEVLSSVAELNGKEGFVIAPFSPSSDCPVLLIHPDEANFCPFLMQKRFQHLILLWEKTLLIVMPMPELLNVSIRNWRKELSERLCWLERQLCELLIRISKISL